MATWFEATLIVGGFGIFSWVCGVAYSTKHVLTTMEQNGWTLFDQDGNQRQVKK